MFSRKTSYKVKTEYIGEFSEDEIVKKLFNNPEILRRYYDTLIEQYQGILPVISPVKMPRWVSDAANWLSNGETVADIGYGDGTLATKVLTIGNSKIQDLWLIDFARHAMDVVRGRIAERRIEMPPIKIEIKPWNVEMLSRRIKKPIFDRIIAINIIGDTNPAKSLREIFKILKPGGIFRATYYRKETFDKLWEKELGNSYFEKNGWGVWLTPPSFYKGNLKRVAAITLIEDTNIKK